MRTFDPIDTEFERVLLSPDPRVTPGNPAPAQSPSDFVYDLRLDGPSSERFYSNVAGFSTRVLAQVERAASAALDGYTRYVTGFLKEPPRSRGEYALELLTVGMAIR